MRSTHAIAPFTFPRQLDFRRVPFSDFGQFSGSVVTVADLSGCPSVRTPALLIRVPILAQRGASESRR